MNLKRRWLAIPLALMMVAGTFVLGQSAAGATTDRCPKGYKVVKKTPLLSDGKDKTKSAVLILQKKGRSYCATFEHRGKAKGDPIFTQVSLDFDRTIAASDPPLGNVTKKYSSHAGPIIATAKKGTVCVDAVGNLWGKGDKTGHNYDEWAWTHDHRNSTCF